MEIEVGDEENHVEHFKALMGEKSNSSSLPSPKHSANPVVYKLVRVEQDGRLIPATDDEVMEVESLIIHDMSEVHVAKETMQIVGCISDGGPSTGIVQSETSEGLLPSENTADSEKIIAQDEETVPCSKLSSSESCMIPTGIVGECSNNPDMLDGDTHSPSDYTTTVPDFSKLHGEICLDALSIRELHETFRATFGRETTVKDKHWLKRRIAMGLTNSCDIPTTSFIIEDNKFVKKGNMETCGINDVAGRNLVSRTRDGNQTELPIGHGSQLEHNQVISKEILRNHSIYDGVGSDHHDAEFRASRRTRKPTKRYIEELSQVETKDSGGRLMTPVRNSGLGVMSPKAFVRPLRNVSSDWRNFITQIDSHGGPGMWVPRVSRVRRSRPRKNFMALLKFKLDDVSVAATLVNKALTAHTLAPDVDSGSKIPKEKPACKRVQFAGVREQDKQVLAMDAVGQEHSMAPTSVHSSGNSADKNMVSMRTSKGRIRRKHHRAWTLSEVVKLVDGVSKYGAGKWSEIKRLAFASYSYRTSVDLKDKWRNLLKASFHLPGDKAVTWKKNAASPPIPAPILLKVRELAEMKSQVSSNNSVTV